MRALRAGVSMTSTVRAPHLGALVDRVPVGHEHVRVQVAQLVAVLGGERLECHHDRRHRMRPQPGALHEHPVAHRRLQQRRPEAPVGDGKAALVGVSLPASRRHTRVQLEHVRAELLELQPSEPIEVVGHQGHSLPRTASARQYSRTTAMSFPQTRLRRLRANRALRGLVRETRLEAADFVYPMFVAHGIDRREPIKEMPGVDHLSIAHAVEEAGEAAALGIPAVLLFGLPASKDDEGSGAWDEEGIVQLATRAIKEAHPDLLVITDLCLCEYTSHGHCGVLRETAGGLVVDNDATLELLSRTAVSQARAGADIIAPAT